MHVNIVLHLLADGEWQKICHGMISFATSKGKNACNCLMCPAHASQRADVEKYWHRYPDRFDNEHIGIFGRIKEDLFPFVPAERRWMENMHLVLRFVGDKLVAEAFTCIVNDEFDTEAQGMNYCEEQMHSSDIGVTEFKFYGGKARDASAEAKLSWAGMSYTTLLRVAEHTDVASGFKKHPGKGARLQRALRGFLEQYKELMVWPGDGPKVSELAIFKANSELLADLLGHELPEDHPQTPPEHPPSLTQAAGSSEDDPDDNDCKTAVDDEQDETSSAGASPGESASDSDASDESAEPGEEKFEDKYFPTTTITPYAHMFNCHWGQMYEASKKLAYLFQNVDAAETNADWKDRGGLKAFLTQALEPTNLQFFHATFQSLDRHTKEFMYAAGMQMLRKLFNPACIDRSKLWCQ